MVFAGSLGVLVLRGEDFVQHGFRVCGGGHVVGLTPLVDAVIVPSAATEIPLPIFTPPSRVAVATGST